MECGNYYVYEHYRPNCDEPFYVGKGCGNRAHTINNRKNLHWKRIAKKYGFEVRVVAEKMSEFNAILLEISLIACWGRMDMGVGPLVNHTDGGEGFSGLIVSDSVRKGRQKRMLGNKYAEGYKHSEEWKTKMRLLMTGRKCPKNSEHMKKRIGDKNPLTGTHHSDDWKREQSNRSRGNQYAKGTKHTDEWKKKQSERMKLLWQKRREEKNS